jgi:hypothetical protein
MEPSQETKNALVDRQVSELDQKIKALEKIVDGLVEERHDAIKWALIVIGSAFVGLLVWIFNAFVEPPK